MNMDTYSQMAETTWDPQKFRKFVEVNCGSVEGRDKIAHVFNLMYAALGLCGEAGEIANKTKKILRDKNGYVDFETLQALSDELGDVKWYWNRLVCELRLVASDVCHRNLKKLADRLNRGVIGGSGDKR